MAIETNDGRVLHAPSSLCALTHHESWSISSAISVTLLDEDYETQFRVLLEAGSQPRHVSLMKSVDFRSEILEDFACLIGHSCA